MQNKITTMVGHISVSYMQMARILEAKRDMTSHSAGLVHAVPDDRTTFTGTDEVTGHTLEISKSVAGYLSSLADLEDAIAESMTVVMKELDPQAEE